MTRLLRVLATLAGLAVAVSLMGAKPAPADVDAEYIVNRAKLVSYIIRDQMSQYHYSKKPINDDLSRAAFDLYLKQLDFQKRFLLQEDVAKLQAFSLKIDDEIKRSLLELPLLGAKLLEARVGQVQEMVNGLLEKPFDLDLKESIETDPEKLQYCRTAAELRERWRQILKYQLANRYLNLLEDDGLDSATEHTSEKGQAVLEKAVAKIRKSQESFFHRMLQETEQDYYDRYFSAVTRAFDPHSIYLPPQKKEDFDIGMRGSLEGIGATLREEDGYIKVVQIIPGSAAARQGQLGGEDVILEVAEGDDEPVDVTDTRLRDAVSLIRGPKGTEVRLTVRKPEGTRMVIPIVRDVVQIEETFVKSAVLHDEELGKNFGYVKIPSFYRDFEGMNQNGKGRNATADVRRELEAFGDKDIAGVILDLRDNGGGALTDAVDITGLFIDLGPVVQVKDHDGRITVLRDRDPAVVYDGPLVVLVNQFSASASEILAGALQDYRRAVIVGGEHTHGKGTVQSILDLNRQIPFRNMFKYRPLGALKLTVQKFYRVSGASTQYRGVVPDIILPDRLNHLKSGEQYLDYSLPWDTVDSVAHNRWAPEEWDLDKLKLKSRERVAADPEFAEITLEASKAATRRDKTMQSLRIADIRQERQEIKDLGESMDRGHGTKGDAADEEEGQVSDEEKHRRWVNDLHEDPYAGEAMAILVDLAAEPKQVTVLRGRP